MKKLNFYLPYGTFRSQGSQDLQNSQDSQDSQRFQDFQSSYKALKPNALFNSQVLFSLPRVSFSYFFKKLFDKKNHKNSSFFKNKRSFILFFIMSLAFNGCSHKSLHQNSQTASSLSQKSFSPTTGDLAIIIERAHGSLLIASTSNSQVITRIKGLGDLSHASVVFSRDQRFAYVFGRDGGLTQIDLVQKKLARRIIQSGNSIGGAISEDSRFVAVSNYKPGGVKVFDALTLELIADIPTTDSHGTPSKVVGLVDAPGHRFIFSLFDAGEIWIADFSKSKKPQITRFKNIGKQPYDALISPNGRYYVAGLFGEDGLSVLDLWHIKKGPQKVLTTYGRGSQKMPVYKMPHLEGWAIVDSMAYIPAVGRNEVLVVNTKNWSLIKKIPVKGQPVFVMSEPTQRHVWVNFAFPNNKWVQVIETQSNQVVKTLSPGKGVLHMEFFPKGNRVWLSVRDEDRVDFYDTFQFTKKGSFKALKPSGIFFTDRAYKIGL